MTGIHWRASDGSAGVCAASAKGPALATFAHGEEIAPFAFVAHAADGAFFVAGGSPAQGTSSLLYTLSTPLVAYFLIRTSHGGRPLQREALSASMAENQKAIPVLKPDPLA